MNHDYFFFKRIRIIRIIFFVTQISQITQIFFQSPAEIKEIKEMFLFNCEL